MEGLDKYKEKPKKPARGMHSELHVLVATLRQEFGETTDKGVGSFGFYLKLLKPVPIPIIYQWLAEIKQSKGLYTPESRRKIFWWHYKKRKVEINTGQKVIPN